MNHHAKISWRSVKPLHDGDFHFFQHGCRPPSWICCVRVWTTRVFGGVYHCAKFFPKIDVVVSIICKL